MDIEIINNNKEPILNYSEKEHNSVRSINKNNDENTTKDDDSTYILDEIISYCSSPTSGIISINKKKNDNNSFIINNSEISNITNTITFKIAMMKKEINNTEINNTIGRSNTSKKKVNKEQKEKENDNNSFINHKTNSNKDSNNQNDKDKRDKITSFFKKKTKKLKDKIINKLYEEEVDKNNSIHSKKKISKGKKKKKKSLECYENDIKRNIEHSKSTTNIEKHKNNKNIRKKTQKLKENKVKDKDIDGGKSPKIIILDFSSSGNNDDDNISNKEIKKNKSKDKDKKNKKKNSVSYLKISNFNKINENEFLLKRNKTKNEVDESNNKLKKEFYTEKKIVIPKQKNSSFISSTSYQINNMKIENNLNNRKLSANYTTNSVSTNITKIKAIKENKKDNKKDKKRQTEDFFAICASKNFNHNDEQYNNKIINTKAIKENIKKRNKNKIKNKNSKDESEVQSRKDSNKSCHNTPNKKFRHIISHNYDKKVNNIEKKLNMNMKGCDSSVLTLTNTPKNFRPKKSIYQSNRNLTNIKISSQAVETKDIHLEMNGKQETIINYTNQELVDDENEYMVECFKILVKLDLSKQPRCKSKVNFNFENSPAEKNKKKIALFDLDETLVHCTKEQKGLNGDLVKIKLPTNKVVNVGLNIRPHWKEALDIIKKHYHIVVYTASHQSYADAVLDYLDKENKYFQYRLYRNHCVQCDVDGIKFYVKDLDTLNEKYNLKDVVIIDNSVLSFAYHLNNGIPIVPYIEQKEDSQLLMLAYYLVSIANYDDLTEENKKHINIEHFISEVKNLENGEEEFEDEDDDGEGNNNNNQEPDNNTINEIKSEDGEYNSETQDKVNNDDIQKKEIKKEGSIDNKKNTKRISYRKSEKALKIANDMKQSMAGVYNKKYN